MFLSCPQFDILPIFLSGIFLFCFLVCFSTKICPENPAKSAVFSANLSLQIPWNFTFFPANYQKPCNYHTYDKTNQTPWELWFHFFRVHFTCIPVLNVSTYKYFNKRSWLTEWRLIIHQKKVSLAQFIIKIYTTHFSRWVHILPFQVDQAMGEQMKFGLHGQAFLGMCWWS